MTTSSLADVIQRLKRSRLLSDEQFRQACLLLEQESDAQRGMLRLVSSDLISRWQAKQLLTAEKPKFFVGQYKLLKEIGRGSMGIVYRAFHMSMSRLVALKVLPHEFTQDPRAVARFEREIRTIAALDHPNIVHALDAGREKRLYYLVMEYVDGKDLRQWIKTFKTLPIPWSCECVRQAAIGLQHAWERGVTHRDIKPSNLLVCGRVMTHPPKVKIVDFGLARVSEDLAGDMKLTRVGRTVGTWEYMAPEQTQNSSLVDIRSDLFSLGCAFFQMATGELPFRGRNEVESLMVRVNTDAPRLRQVIPQIDGRLDDIVAKMLARKPADRYQTPAELVTALESLPLLNSPPLPEPARLPTPPQLPATEVDTNTGLENTDPEFNQFLKTTSSASAIQLVTRRKEHSPVRSSQAFRRYAGAILISVLLVSSWLLWLLLSQGAT